MHSSIVVGAKYGNWDTSCTTCHNPHQQEQNLAYKTTYGKYIKEYICFDNPVTGLNIQEFVKFTAPTGTGSFADGVPYNENVCEMCHTQTNHHRRDGSAPGDAKGGSYVGHFDGKKCTDCHPHADGFYPSGGVAQSPHNTAFFNSNCQLCHVESGGRVDFSAKIPDTNCQRCHGERDAHTSDPARNEFATGNYTYSIMCVDCHDPMISVEGNRKLLRPQIEFSVIPGSNVVNTKRIGPGSLADGPPRNENICETCHANTSHNKGDGTGNGVHADGINYDGAYCMLCHDHNKSFMVPGTSAEE
ncbi:MAG: cytochrome c3 family protein [Nitrospirae bacterium]|nr:cytochrome c3 family protein [Nitrospirota bacterium]